MNKEALSKKDFEKDNPLSNLHLDLEGYFAEEKRLEKLRTSMFKELLNKLQILLNRDEITVTARDEIINELERIETKLREG